MCKGLKTKLFFGKKIPDMKVHCGCNRQLAEVVNTKREFEQHRKEEQATEMLPMCIGACKYCLKTDFSLRKLIFDYATMSTLLLPTW